MRIKLAALPLVALLAAGCSEAPTPVGPDLAEPSFSRAPTQEWSFSFDDKKSQDDGTVIGVLASSYTFDGTTSVNGEGQYGVRLNDDNPLRGELKITGVEGTGTPCHPPFSVLGEGFTSLSFTATTATLTINGAPYNFEGRLNTKGCQ